jgi:probable phosphoglycerate mutase
VAYSSTLRRSKETAAIALGGRAESVLADARLDEIDYGHWDGLTKGQIEREFPEEFLRFTNDPFQFHPTGSNAVEACASRAWEWLTSLKAPYTFAFAHKTWTRLLICKIFGISYHRYRTVMDIKIAGVCCLLKTNEGWRIEALNYEATRTRIYGTL